MMGLEPVRSPLPVLIGCSPTDMPRSREWLTNPAW